VNIDTVHFPAEPKLDGIIEKRLLQMTRTNPPPTSLQRIASNSWHRRPRNSSYLQAKVREQHDGW
jgi:hypothetical protein